MLQTVFFFIYTCRRTCQNKQVFITLLILQEHQEQLAHFAGSWFSFCACLPIFSQAFTHNIMQRYSFFLVDGLFRALLMLVASKCHSWDMKLWTTAVFGGCSLCRCCYCFIKQTDLISLNFELSGEPCYHWHKPLHYSSSSSTSIHPFIHLLYLLGGNPGSLPPWPPALHHGDETREHDAGGEDAENAGEAVDVQSVAILSRLDRAVEVTGAVLGPPFQFQYIHVAVLLELQNPREERHKHARRY